ncbi:MAG: tetratricopeptide repeat protein [Venatoribacter sp.]
MHSLDALVLWCVWAWAANPTITKLQELIKQQNYAEAYQLASQHIDELEGDAEFDFLYGLSALQSGELQAALFSFERLSASYPQVQRYRLELARSYFYLGNLDEAKQQFNKVLASNPPDAVKNNIEKFLVNIENQRQAIQSQWRASVTLAGGYDSNYNSATDIEQFEILNGWVTKLTEDQRQQGSAFGQLRMMGSYSSPLSRLSSWDISAALNHKAVFDNSDFNLSVVGAQAGYRRLFNNWQLRPFAGVNQYWLGGESYQQDYSLGLETYWRYSSKLQPFARVQYGYSDNAINNDLDFATPQVEAGLSAALGEVITQLSLSYSSDQAQADVKTQAKDSLGLSLFAQYQGFYASYSYRTNQYQGKMVVLDKKRDDNLNQLLLGYRHSLGKQLSLYAQTSYLKNNSNIDLYQYQRALSELGLTLTF